MWGERGQAGARGHPHSAARPDWGHYHSLTHGKALSNDSEAIAEWVWWEIWRQQMPGWGL